MYACSCSTCLFASLGLTRLCWNSTTADLIHGLPSLQSQWEVVYVLTCAIFVVPKQFRSQWTPSPLLRPMEMDATKGGPSQLSWWGFPGSKCESKENTSQDRHFLSICAFPPIRGTNGRVTRWRMAQLMLLRLSRSSPLWCTHIRAHSTTFGLSLTHGVLNPCRFVRTEEEGRKGEEHQRRRVSQRTVHAQNSLLESV